MIQFVLVYKNRHKKIKQKKRKAYHKINGTQIIFSHWIEYMHPGRKKNKRINETMEYFCWTKYSDKENLFCCKVKTENWILYLYFLSWKIFNTFTLSFFHLFDVKIQFSFNILYIFLIYLPFVKQTNTQSWNNFYFFI